MNDSVRNREARQTGRRVKQMALATTTATALAVGLAAAPAAQAGIPIDREFTWDPVYSSGLVAGLIDFVSKIKPGLDAQLSDTISFHTGPPPSLSLSVLAPNVFNIADVNVDLNLNLRKTEGSKKNLYNTVGGIPQPGCNQGYGYSVTLGPVSAKGYASTCRYAVQLATLGTVQNLIDAFRAQISSVGGDTPSGLIPFTSGPNATPTFNPGTNNTNLNGSSGPAYTNQALILLQNHLRPNGGLAARFPGISKAVGIDPVMPGAGLVKSPDGKIALNTTTLDLTWAYDPIADFPAVFNLPAITNSLLGALPINIVTGGLSDEPLQGSSLGDIGTNLASLLQFKIDYSIILVADVKTLPMEDGKAFYSTLVPNVLPITAAMGLPGTAVNFALSALKSKYLLGNPVGDALAPAMKILVNTGYTDVLTPNELNYCATGCGTAAAQTWAQLGYTAYDRTFGAYAAPGSVTSAATETPFNSVKILTPEEETQKKADVKAALMAGIKEQMAKPFWGIIVPNPAKAPAPAAKAVGARTAAPAESTDPAPAVDATAPVAVTSVPDATPALTSAAPVVSAPAAKAPKAKSANRAPGRAAASASKARLTR